MHTSTECVVSWRHLLPTLPLRYDIVLSKVVSHIDSCQARFALTSAQVFSCTDLITNSEHFYTSILNLLDDTDKKDEVDQLLMWWNRYVFIVNVVPVQMTVFRQIFPLYADREWVPSKNSTIAQIRQKHKEIKERVAHTCIATSDLAWRLVVY